MISFFFNLAQKSLAFAEKRPYLSIFLMSFLCFWMPLLFFSFPFQGDDFHCISSSVFGVNGTFSSSLGSYFCSQILMRTTSSLHSIFNLNFPGRYFFYDAFLDLPFAPYVLLFQQKTENIMNAFLFVFYFLNAVLFFKFSSFLDDRKESVPIRIVAVMMFIPLFFIPEMFSNMLILVRAVALTTVLGWLFVKKRLSETSSFGGFLCFSILSVVLLFVSSELYESTVFYLLFVLLFLDKFLNSKYAKFSLALDFLLVAILVLVKAFFFPPGQAMAVSPIQNMFLGIQHVCLYVFSFFVPNFHGYLLWGTIPILGLILWFFYSSRTLVFSFFKHKKFLEFSFFTKLFLFCFGYLMCLSFMIPHYAPRGLYIMAPVFFLLFSYGVFSAFKTVQKRTLFVFLFLFFSVLNLYCNGFYQNKSMQFFEDMGVFLSKVNSESVIVVKNFNLWTGIPEAPDDVSRTFGAMFGLEFEPKVVLLKRNPSTLYDGVLSVIKEKLKIQFSPITYKFELGDSTDYPAKEMEF